MTVSAAANHSPEAGATRAPVPLARYIAREDGAERILFARRFRGRVRLVDRPIGGSLRDRWEIAAKDLPSMQELQTRARAWLETRAQDVIERAELLA